MAYDGNYTAIVQVAVSDEKLKKQLETVSTKAKPVDLKVKINEEGIESLKKGLGDSNKELQNFNNSGKNANKTSKQLGDSLKNTGKQAQSLGSEFASIVGKVGKFYTATLPIQAMQNAVRDAISQVVEFDSSLAELKKVTDLSGDSLKNFQQDAFDLAEQLSTTASNVIDATTEFSKSGFSLEESKAMAEQALVFKTIADGEISASEAATTLIQVTKAYNMTAQDSEHIINAL